MKISQLAFYNLSFMCLLNAETSTNVYVEEFKAFKNSADYQLIFKKDANLALQIIERDIENCKHLSWFQRFVRSTFLSFDAIVVSPKTMPKLYAYIDSICKKAEIKTPTIFLTREKCFFNAMAEKLLISSGAILIGQKLLLETSPQELEAVAAHEIGHIVYNHVNKKKAINILNALAAVTAINYLTKNNEARTVEKSIIEGIIVGITAGNIANYITPLIINKRFEKQADEFAYKFMNKGNGLIEFCQHLEKMTNDEDQDFNHTREMLTKSKPEIGLYSYAGLSTIYYLAKFEHILSKAYRWLYHNTPFGEHPSPEARIKATQDYLNSQASDRLTA